MIDSQSRDFSFFDEFEHVLMCCVENFVALDSQSNQVADIKKPPIVDSIRGLAPKSEAVMLLRQYLIDVHGFGACRNRQFLFVISENGSPALEPDNKFLVVQDLAVRPAENWQQHFFGFPIHIKE